MRIGVVGLGYVGLPIAVALSKCFEGTVGFDINTARVADLKNGIDKTLESRSEDLESARLTYSNSIEDLRPCNFFVIAVPTPVDMNNNPDLGALASASRTVGKALKKGDIVVYESTVYPGVTEEFCGPILEEVSGLQCGTDFKLGYSPERINPGDREHTLQTVVKVVSAQDDASLETIAKVYEAVVHAGVHRATSIKVAEAAKVIENTQRDLNIALMNELSMIFDLMNIPTNDVLEAAGTKWNFLKFSPGLVGGHCIGVDPYYLTTAAERRGYHPQVILAGRRINDGMGRHVAAKTIKLMIQSGLQIRESRVGILGVTFKENVPDVRNSRVPDIIRELKEFGCTPLVFDPEADPAEVHHEYGIVLAPFSELAGLDALIVAVPHNQFMTSMKPDILALLRRDGVFIDVKSAFRASDLPATVSYWSL